MITVDTHKQLWPPWTPCDGWRRQSGDSVITVDEQNTAAAATTATDTHTTATASSATDMHDGSRPSDFEITVDEQNTAAAAAAAAAAPCHCCSRPHMQLWPPSACSGGLRRQSGDDDRRWSGDSVITVDTHKQLWPPWTPCDGWRRQSGDSVITVDEQNTAAAATTATDTHTTATASSATDMHDGSRPSDFEITVDEQTAAASAAASAADAASAASSPCHYRHRRHRRLALDRHAR